MSRLHFFGVRRTFAIEIGALPEDPGELRKVDVYADGRWLTCDDNSVFLPQFIGSLQHEVGWRVSTSGEPGTGRPYPELSVADSYRKLKAGALTDNGDYLSYRFMDWGPTADNVGMLLFRENGTAYLPFSFHRPDHHDPSELGQVFVAELPERELLKFLHDAAWALAWDWIRLAAWGER